MIRSFDLIEELQEMYASHYSLTNFITDESGNIIMPAKGNNALFNLLLVRGAVKEIIETVTKEFELSKPFFIDILPGVYACIAPVEGHPGTLLWSGVKIEQSSRDMVKNKIDHLIDGVEVDRLLSQTSTLTLESKKEWLLSVKKAANMISQLKGGGVSLFSEHLKVLQEAFKAEEGNVSRFLYSFLEKNSRIDFLGICEPRLDDFYEVSHAAGEDAEQIQGASFSPGEGFLGRVLLTGEQAFWEGIEKDPKYTFFQKYHFYPKSLFCFPIQLRDGTLSLFFGGSRSSEVNTDTVKDSIKNMAMLMEVILSAESLQKENSGHLSRQSALADISMMLVSAPDLKKISYILVDISMSLVKGPFSAVMLKNPQKQNMMLVSRGNIKGERGSYLKRAAKDYFTATSDLPPDRLVPSMKKLEGSPAIIECPLHFRGEILGLICAGTNGHPNQETEELLPFLHTLSLIAGVSLQLAGEGQENVMERKIEILHSSIKEFDAETNRIAEESFKIAREFTGKLALSEPLIKNILIACKVHCFSHEYLAEKFPEAEFPQIVKDGTGILAEGSAFKNEEPGIGSQIFALAVSYARNEGDMEAIIVRPYMKKIRQEFLSYLEDSQVVEQELTLEPESSHAMGSKSVESTIKNHMNLSSREKEVLDLVIQGLNNKEIAQELYISEHTVKNHLTKIFQKLNVPDRTQAISKVYQLTYNGSANP
ncbi:LuxR C-terminal-related transcriptional regulator [Cytobacillus sp. NCCP-133]|uniref:LuxR C-terminal-related transcriptional regulator n=1 Tax=Cytobacillus sp. NCCP-133 TaxID=766848 RepID=UPI0028133AEB|nr:LuxR C-terminal-related transcriptional regulator [Cytobacillus sp. NCCP-133]GLB60535.1 hypothetical protein NCCP133_26670 [Cytobacillus sp. NCCP-133]